MQDHLDRHHRIIAELHGLRTLHPRVADALRDRTEPGFLSHGELSHHAINFRPLHEAFDEAMDCIDLACVFTRERVELGIAGQLPTPRERVLHAEYEFFMTQAANRLAELLTLMEARDD